VTAFSPALPAAIAADLPPSEATDLWRGVFGNANPVWVEIGPGRGEFLVGVARQNTATNFFAVERSASRALGIEDKIENARLANARVVNAEAACLLALLPDACIAGYFVQFPDPWWKRRHGRRRLMTPELVAVLSRTLVADGTIELITDVEEYFLLAQDHLGAEPRLECLTSGRTDYGVTNFARKALARGDAIYRSVHRRRVSV